MSPQLALPQCVYHLTNSTSSYVKSTLLSLISSVITITGLILNFSRRFPKSRYGGMHATPRSPNFVPFRRKKTASHI